MANPGQPVGNDIDTHAQASTPATKPGGETRGAPRRRVLKSGIVAFNGRFCTLPCMVRDVSEIGARLRLDGAINAPDTFELIIETDGLEADCEVVWRRGNEIGVRFLHAPRHVTPKKTQVIGANVPAHVPSLRRKPKTPEPT